MIQGNGLQIWLDTWFSSWSLGKILYLTNMFQSCNSERPVFVDWCTVPVYPSENQQGIQIEEGNHFANLCFWLSCHFLLHEGKEICETFVGPRRLLRKTLGWISQHNLLVKHEITSLRLFADLYHWAPFSRRVAVESSYHWLFISQLLLVSPKISIHRGPWVIDNPGSLERSSKAVSNVLGCFRRSQSPQCIKASILTSLPLVTHTVETRCALIQGECYVDLDSAQGTLKLRTPEQQGSPRFLRLLGRPSPSKPDHHWGKRMPQLRPMPQLQQMPQPHPMVQVIQCQRQDSLDEPGVQMECLQMRVQRWKSISWMIILQTWFEQALFVFHDSDIHHKTF